MPAGRQRTAQWGREYAAFCDTHRIRDAVQVVVRPPRSLVPIAGLRAAHKKYSDKLSSRLRYGADRLAHGFACDIVAAEVVAVTADGDEVDLHFHLAVRANAGDLAAMRDYFTRAGWRWWDAVTARSAGCHHPPGALASYVAKGLAHALNRNADAGRGFSPQNTAELYRQTHGLAMVRSTGAFRRWKAQLERDGLVVADGACGRPILQPRRRSPVLRRFRKPLLASASLQVLRLCHHDFGDGIKRPAVLVRGSGAVTFGGVAAVYDLSHAIASARRQSLVLLKNTANPESQRVTLGAAKIAPRSGLRIGSDPSAVPSGWAMIWAFHPRGGGGMAVLAGTGAF